MAVLVAGQRGDVFIPDEQFPWNSLAEQTLTMAVSLEVLRWLAAWLLAVSAVAFVLYVVCVTLLCRGESRAARRAGKPAAQPNTRARQVTVNRQRLPRKKLMQKGATVKTKLFLLIVSSALTCLAPACATPPVEDQKPVTAASASAQGTTSATPPSAEPTPAPTPTVDYRAIAQKVVAQCAAVKQGEIIQISGDAKDAELLEELALEVSKLGAFPLVNMFRSNPERAKRAMQEIPAKWDTQVNQLGLKLAGLVNANITLANAEPFNLFEDFPQERLDAQRKANEPISALRRQRNIRSIAIGGNGLYPSKANSERLGLTQAELAQIFWHGINTDYTQLQADGERYRQLLAAANEVHLTHPNGTDLKVKITKRPVFVSDGVISAEDIKRGGQAVQLWLPAGEVYVTVVPGTAEGRVVVDRENYLGAQGNTLIEGLTLDFKAGKLVSMTARAGLEPLKKAYDKVTGQGGAGKDQFSFVDLGINRSLVLGPHAKRGDYAPAGMVSLGFGGNEQYGGANKAAWGYETNLAGCTVRLDGKVVVENGALRP